MWSVKGGCTLSQPCGNRTCIGHIAPKERAPITSRNQIRSRANINVDGTGGESHPNNILEENFQCGLKSRVMGRQAQAIPQNLEAWCPGSLRTNLATTHHRAVVAKPMSAANLLEIGSWLDHPRSYYNETMRHAPGRTGPPSRRKVEAARGLTKFSRIIMTTAGFYFGSSVDIWE